MDHVRRGYDAAAAGLAAEAEGHFRRGLEDPARRMDAHLALGELYLRQARWEESRQHYAAVVAERPFHAVAQLNLAVIALCREELSAAAEHADLARKNSKDKRVLDESGIILRAVVHARTLRGEALDLEEQLAQRPDDLALLSRLIRNRRAYAAVFSALNLREPAERALARAQSALEQTAMLHEAALAARPDDVTAALALGNACTDLAWLALERGDQASMETSRQRALRELDALRASPQAQAAAPLLAASWYATARLRLLDDDAKGALACIEQARTLADDDARYHAAAAELLFRLRRPRQEMVEPLRRAAELAPSEAVYHILYGDALWRAGDVAAASAAYRKALQHATLPADVQRAQLGLKRIHDGVSPDEETAAAPPRDLPSLANDAENNFRETFQP